ncbi:MAG: invasion associated locus B family protein [Gammaproteobacteria bacterium]
MFHRFACCLVGLLLWCAAAPTLAADESTHGSWTVRCEEVTNDDEQECIMYQNLVLRTGGQPVLQLSVGLAPPDNLPTAVLNLPLGIYLPPGIGIRIDSAAQARFPVERCDPDGCQAVMKLRDKTVAELRQGSKLEIEFHDSERAPLHMPLSLDGFGAAFDAISADD